MGPGKLLTEEGWYKDGQWTNYKPINESGQINIYVEKPDNWKEIWIWYDSDLSTEEWDTTKLKASPGEMRNYRTGWYKKTISNTVKSNSFLMMEVGITNCKQMEQTL